ncbi:hypothetical protein BJY28_001562 [Janibacter alkaliphilus]|uniref:Uncharacterized protein n=1 Tax=Janibacter alkaliphilus TaxID=1069963 RepID=A0A852X8K9_9MICO|nr:hypothetical protein [Janibacter alkaliphilus]
MSATTVDAPVLPGATGTATAPGVTWDTSGRLVSDQVAETEARR